MPERRRLLEAAVTGAQIDTLLRGFERRRKRHAQAIWFGVCFGIGAQAFGIILGFLHSWQHGLKAIANGALGMTVWIPVLLYMRKTAIMTNASAIASEIIQGLSANDPNRGDSDVDAAPFSGLLCRLAILKVGILAWGTPEGKWKDGCDPYHSHPDDRRRRLMELLTIAAWRDLPEVPWKTRLDMIALAQICIAAEVIQSRSLSGRIRNGLLRVFARRPAQREIAHVVPVDEVEP
jgi:hypothetical protein